MRGFKYNWMRKGLESRHFVQVFNSMKGRIFSKKSYRRVFQHLFSKYYNEIGVNDLDPQVYLPFQSGRLSRQELKEALKLDQNEIADAQKKLENTNITILTANKDSYIKKIVTLLKRDGFDKINIEETNFQNLVQQYYKNYKADIIELTFSIDLGDPDGVYHFLGPNGAITSPILAKQKIGLLLENGRKITDIQELDSFYKKVNQLILQEAPFFHGYFLSTETLYNKNNVSHNGHLRDRHDAKYSSFKPI